MEIRNFKTMIRTCFFAVAAAFCCVLFAGCGQAEQKTKIGISIPAADHGWTGGVVYWANQARKAIEAENPGYEVIVSTARDAAEQVDKVENLLVQGIKALVILPHEPGPLTAVCEQAAKQGVKLVVVDRGLTKDIADVTVSGDNPGFGRAGAQAIAKAINGKGNIVIMEGIPCVVNSDRVNAFKTEIAKYPGIKILDSQAANWDTEKGMRLMENFLQKYQKIDAVWTGDDDVLLGALKAYEESKRSDVQSFVGGAGAKLIVKMVMDGHKLVRFDVTYPPKMIEVGARQAVALLKNVKVEPRQIVPAEIIDQKNAKNFYYPDSVF